MMMENGSNPYPLEIIGILTIAHANHEPNTDEKKCLLKYIYEID
jgi:hypothetical protein